LLAGGVSFGSGGVVVVGGQRNGGEEVNGGRGGGTRGFLSSVPVHPRENHQPANKTMAPA